MPDEQVPEENTGHEASNIEKKLTEADPNVFEGIPKQKKQQIIRSLVVTLQKSHSGPLPSPETLAGYSSLIPNGADRIMQMAEKQQEHRMQMEKSVIKSQMAQSNIGQFLAFFIGLAALGASTYCIVTGHEWSGSILGLGGLTSLVTAFIKGKSEQAENLKEKRSAGKK